MSTIYQLLISKVMKIRYWHYNLVMASARAGRPEKSCIIWSSTNSMKKNVIKENDTSSQKKCYTKKQKKIEEIESDLVGIEGPTYPPNVVHVHYTVLLR